MAKIYGVGGLPKLMKGYPTVTNQIDIQGGLLGGDTEVKFGDVVKFGTNPGVYVAIKAADAGTITKANLAGIVVATNAKLVGQYPADGAEVGYKVNEAINLLPFAKDAGGFLAVGLVKATLANIAEGKKVAIWLSGTNVGKLTTTGASDTQGETTITATDLDGVYFTGIVENKGTAAAPVYVAEIAIKG